MGNIKIKLKVKNLTEILTKKWFLSIICSVYLAIGSVTWFVSSGQLKDYFKTVGIYNLILIIYN